MRRYGEVGLTRIAAMSEAMQANHPSDPHHYLFIVGVDPDLQGRGLGARLHFHPDGGSLLTGMWRPPAG